MAWYPPEAENVPPPPATPLGSPLATPPPSAGPSTGAPWYYTDLPETQNATLGPDVAPEQFGPPAPVAPYGFSNAAAHGYTLGLDEPARGAGMATGRFLAGKGFNYPEAVAEVGRGRAAYAAEHPWANLGGNLLGGITSPVTGPGGVATKAIEATPTWLGKLATSTGISGFTGGVQGAAENTTSIDDMLRGARIGGEYGGAVGAAVPVASAIGGAAFPRLSQEARLLRAAGVTPTPGPAYGGIPGVIENTLSHIPFVGAPIRAAREVPQAQLQTGLANLNNYPLSQAALSTAGKILPKASSDVDTAVKVGSVPALAYTALEHPEWLNPVNHPWLFSSAVLGNPAMRALYSDRGQRMVSGLLSAAGEVSPAIAPYGPLGGQVAPGLLTGLFDQRDRQTQP